MRQYYLFRETFISSITSNWRYKNWRYKFKSCNLYLHVLPKNKGLSQKPNNLIHHQLLVIDCDKCSFRYRKGIIRIGMRTKYVSEERFTCVINGFFNIFLGSRVVTILSFFTTYEKRFGLSVTSNWYSYFNNGQWGVPLITKCRSWQACIDFIVM
jgi:hypothetical protein